MKKVMIFFVLFCMLASNAFAGTYRKIGNTTYYTDDSGATYPAQIGTSSFVRGEGGSVGTMSQVGNTTVITSGTGGVQFGERTGGTTNFRQAAGPDETAEDIWATASPEATPSPEASPSPGEKPKETDETAEINDLSS